MFDKTIIQYGEVKCTQCGYNLRFTKPEHLIDYKKMAGDFENKYKQLFHHINTLISFCEKEYGLNLQKESLIKKLLELRNLYNPYN